MGGLGLEAIGPGSCLFLHCFVSAMAVGLGCGAGIDMV